MPDSFLHRLAREIVFVDSVTVGERGQVAIPAEIRRELEIAGGAKLFALRLKGGKGFLLLTPEGFAELARGVPVEALTGVFNGNGNGKGGREDG